MSRNIIGNCNYMTKGGSSMDTPVWGDGFCAQEDNRAHAEERAPEPCSKTCPGCVFFKEAKFTISACQLS